MKDHGIDTEIGAAAVSTDRSERIAGLVVSDIDRVLPMACNTAINFDFVSLYQPFKSLPFQESQNRAYMSLRRHLPGYYNLRLRHVGLARNECIQSSSTSCLLFLPVTYHVKSILEVLSGIYSETQRHNDTTTRAAQGHRLLPGYYEQVGVQSYLAYPSSSYHIIGCANQAGRCFASIESTKTQSLRSDISTTSVQTIDCIFKYLPHII